MNLMSSALVAVLLMNAAPSSGPLVNISEIFYDATGSDDGLVFVELYGPAVQSLEGFVLQGVNGSNGEVTVELGLSGEIPSDGFVFADLAGASSSVSNADLLLDFDFQTGPGSVVLRDASGAVVDALGYVEFAPTDRFAGEGQAAVDPPGGQSLARASPTETATTTLRTSPHSKRPSPGMGPSLFQSRDCSDCWRPHWQASR